MILAIETVIGIIAFTAIVVPLTLKDPIKALGDYPPAIRKRCEELGLAEKREHQLTARDLIRKGLAMIVMCAVLSVVLKYVNHAETFLQGFAQSYFVWLAITWYDALILDCLWFCHSPKVRIPGTEDMPEYQDYFFHIKQSCIGTLLGLPVCLLAGLIVTVL